MAMARFCLLCNVDECWKSCRKSKWDWEARGRDCQVQVCREYCSCTAYQFTGGMAKRIIELETFTGGVQGTECKAAIATGQLYWEEWEIVSRARGQSLNSCYHSTWRDPHNPLTRARSLCCNELQSSFLDIHLSCFKDDLLRYVVICKHINDAV